MQEMASTHSKFSRGGMPSVPPGKLPRYVRSTSASAHAINLTHPFLNLAALVMTLPDYPHREIGEAGLREDIIPWQIWGSRTSFRVKDLHFLRGDRISEVEFHEHSP